MGYVKNARARVQLILDGKLLEYTMAVDEVSITDSEYYQFEVKLTGTRTDADKWVTP
jgi:hypothetical protein